MAGYTSGRTVKSLKAKPAGLTVTKATSQVRRMVEKSIPGVGATVASRGSWDLKNDVPLMVTTITHPADEAKRAGLVDLLGELTGLRSIETYPNVTVVTREP